MLEALQKTKKKYSKITFLLPDDNNLQFKSLWTKPSDIKLSFEAFVNREKMSSFFCFKSFCHFSTPNDLTSIKFEILCLEIIKNIFVLLQSFCRLFQQTYHLNFLIRTLLSYFTPRFNPLRFSFFVFLSVPLNDVHVFESFY